MKQKQILKRPSLVSQGVRKEEKLLESSVSKCKLLNMDYIRIDWEFRVGSELKTVFYKDDQQDFTI